MTMTVMSGKGQLGNEVCGERNGHLWRCLMRCGASPLNQWNACGGRIAHVWIKCKILVMECEIYNQTFSIGNAV